MNLEFRVIEIEKRDPRTVAAMDQAIWESCDKRISPPTLVYHNWEPSITIAKNQLLSDLNLEKCEELGHKVVRVGSGGKAVVHFPDTEFSYSLFVPSPKNTRMNVTRIYEEYCGKIRDALVSFGLQDVRVQGNDIFVGDKKIGGNAQRAKKDMTMQHGIILYQKPNAETMMGFMNQSLYPPGAVDELDQILTGFTNYSQATQEELRQRMTVSLTGNSYNQGNITQEENERICQLLNEYSTLSQGTIKVPMGLCWYPAPVYIQWKADRKRQQEVTTYA